MITSVQLETYMLPKFYSILEELGVESIAPQSNKEVYRGEYEGSKIIIYLDGRIVHNNDKRLQEMIDLAIDELQEKKETKLSDPEENRVQYMVLAKPSVPSATNYPVNHLNIWLNTEQYQYAIELLDSHPDVKQKKAEYEFEEYRFLLGGRIIRFHENGKVIAEDGYARFGPILSEAIRQYLPFQEFDLIIGQDEVGNGEYIGPVVVGSVGTTPEELVDLQLIGIKDSKMVPRGITASMSQWIRQTSSVCVTGQLTPLQFNRIRLEKQQSVSQILTNLHNSVIKETKTKMKQLGIADKKAIYIVDQYDRYENLVELEDETHLDIEVRYYPHAEQRSMSVAAASLLAKNERIRWLFLHEKVHNIELKRREINKIRRHERAHQLLKSI